MGICPKDFKPCIDDLCYGSGCLRFSYPMSIMTYCDGCGGLVGMDGDDPLDNCTCELDDDFYDDEP